MAASASVRAMMTDGVPATSAARRAAFSVRTCCCGGDQHLAAEVAALLLRGELVLPVHARGAGLDHGLHQLVGVQRAAEAGLGVGHDRDQPVLDGLDALGELDLVGAQQRVVDAADHLRDRVGRVQRLVRVGVAGVVGVRGDLPAGEVDGAQPGLDLLHGLVAGQGAQGVGVAAGRWLLGELLPQLLARRGGPACALRDAAAEADDVRCRVVTGDAFPAGLAAHSSSSAAACFFGRLLGGLKCCSHLCLLGGLRGRPACVFAVGWPAVPERCFFP